MGNKYSTDTSHWSVDNWAFGTADNVLPIEDVIDEAKQMPMKYFGGNAIQNDTSMQKMQQDLLSVDDTLKRLFFWRKKNKRSKQSKSYEEEYYAPDEESYDRTQPPIIEEDEDPLPPIYVDRSKEPTYQNSSWLCPKCAAQNKEGDTKCSQCKTVQERF